MELRKLLPLLSFIILLLLVGLVWFFPSTGDFRADNPFWNGVSEFSDEFDIVAVDSYDNLPVDPIGTAFVVVPYEEFSVSELEEITDYVSLGGTLLILDDFGFGNQLLDYFGVDARFSGDYLLDPLFNYKNGFFPKITDFESSLLVSNVSSVVFNHCSFLSNVSDVSVIAYSSSFSFVDGNENGKWDDGEVEGAFPVVGFGGLDKGVVVFVSDPSMIINGMIGLDDNLVFVGDLVEMKSSSPVVYVDQSHLPQVALDDAKMVILVVYDFVGLPLVTLSLIVFVFVLGLKPIWQKRKKDEEN